MIYFILSRQSGSINSNLERFWESIYPDITNCPPSKSAFSQARSNLSHEAFIQLNQDSVRLFYQKNHYKKWKGFRVLAIDGSRSVLPLTPSVVDEFGTNNFGPNADSPASLATVSFLYDVFNGLVLDAEIESYNSSESKLAKSHLKHAGEGDLILYDRYYASYALIFLQASKKINFVFRMKDNWWHDVKDFVESGEKDRIVTLKLPSKYKSLKGENPNVPEEVRVRLIKKVKSNGEVQVFCTSLIDQEKYSAKCICNLYKERWGIEEAYKLIKTRLELGDYSGKTALSVRQDFYAKVLMVSLINIFCSDLEPRIEKPGSKRKENNKERKPIVNRTYAATNLKRIFRELVRKHGKNDIMLLIEVFIHKTLQREEYSRKGQSVKRRPLKPRRYYSNIKSC